MVIPNNILAFAASNSRASINQKLVIHAANVFKDELNPAASINLLDLNDFEMPIYSHDRENDTGIPDAAKQFYKAIGEADALLISYAEHNGLYSVAYKNIFDWCSRMNRKLFQDKPMIIMATSPGKNGGGHVLKLANDAGGRFGANILGSLSVGNFQENFDIEQGKLIDPDLATALRSMLKRLLPTD